MSDFLMRNAALALLVGLCITAHAMHENTDTEKTISTLVVRPATLEDLPGVSEVDKEVSFKHFGPLMIEHYPHIYDNKTVEEGLQADLATDAQIFKQCVTEQGDERLHVAYDTQEKCVSGFVLSSKKDHVVNIDLLFVAQAYRRQGAAKKLFTAAIQAFSDVDQCYFYVLDKNEIMLNFVKKLGIESTPVSSDQKTDSGAPAELYQHYKVDIAALRAKLSNNN